MPGFLLHVGATVLCAHVGQAQSPSPNPRVKVGGQPVVTQPVPYVVTGCTLPPNAGGPCVSAQWMSAATRVRVSQQPVLLQDSQATCVPTGTPLTIVLTQIRVKGK